MSLPLTPEQARAVERRDGDFLLAAAAGSGKTRVLTERYVRGVVEDGLAVSAQLAITFTEKAAGELAERVREGLRAAGREREAEAADRGWIDTIHGFCARVLRIHAVAAGVDPRFAVLDAVAAERLAVETFDATVGPADVGLIAAYGHGRLRDAIRGAHAELRARGASARLPDPGPRADPASLLVPLAEAAATLGATSPANGVAARLDACADLLRAGLDPLPRPDVVGAIVPKGNGSAGEALTAYRAAAAALAQAVADAHALAAWRELDDLLGRFDAAYAERKRERSALDFADLELRVHALLVARPDVGEALAARFARILVDEFQDTNPLQTEIIDRLGRGNVFTVGDENQAIYGFRHADVGNFRRRRGRLEPRGETGSLDTNFRARPDVLAVVRETFRRAWQAERLALEPGREAAPAGAEGEPRVELLLTDNGADWGDAVPGRAAPWREAEAAALGERIAELVAAGRPPGEIVVLLRATGDLSTYERAIAARGLRTYVIGGRGYWAQPEVGDLVAWLSVLANPREEQRLFDALASSLGGLRADALVAVATAGREAGGVWRALTADAAPALDRLTEEERARARAFTARAVAERAEVPRTGIEAALERALAFSGLGAALAWAPDGRRRLANVRKLMRLAREWEAAEGPDLRGFLALVADRSGADAAESREGEAPIETGDLDAVRLMTIHRAKGLQFPVVCVADLGRRRPNDDNVIVRLDPRPDGARTGLRVSVLGAGTTVKALDYEAIRADQREDDDDEEKRLFYVAMTRAEERLVLSGAARFDRWPSAGPQAAPITWLGPALVAGLPAKAEGEADAGVDDGVAWRLNRPAGPAAPGPAGPAEGTAPAAPPAAASPPLPAIPAAAAPGLAAAPVGHVSYSSLAAYAACGYRFYLERVLGLPSRDAPAGEGGADPEAAPGLPATTRGSIAHSLLEALDFAAPAPASPEALAAAAALHDAGALTEEDVADLGELLAAFARSPLCARLAAAGAVRREEPFSFALDGLLVSGVLDVAAREGEDALVVDYKTNRLGEQTPAEAVAVAYEVQRLVYAVALLRTGVSAVEVAYAFLEVPEDPVIARFTADELPALEAELRTHAAGLAAQEFPISAAPNRELCRGCPGRGTLCRWPLEATRRAPGTAAPAAPDRASLF